MNSTVKRSFEIVRIIADNQGRFTLSDLIAKTGLNKTTLFRMTKTLEELNILEKRKNHFYLGLSLFELGNRVHIKQIIVDKIHPLLKQLSDEVNETVNLAKLYNGRVLYLDKIESRRSLQIQSSIGDTLPLYCTSLGKSILSIVPDNQFADIIEKIKLKKITKNTLTDKKIFIDQIKEIRTRGYSIDNEEFEEGLVCISIPLYLSEYDFYGSLSLSGPSTRFKGKNLHKMASTLKSYKDLLKEKINNNNGGGNNV